MKTVILTRLTDNGKQTTGELKTEGFSCKTLERPWLNNKKNESCIPTGEYTVEYTNSPRFKRYMYEIKGVKGRSGVRIHKGNYWYDVTGCVLLGKSYADLNKDGELDITESTKTVESFENFMQKETFKLIIQDKPVEEKPATVPTMELLNGKKTYIGLIITLLGTAGLSQYISEGEVSQIVDLVMQVSGILFAAYGRYKTSK